MADEAELGAFLRSRRERVSPESVGLPKGSRRRTPGLRREELAMLAGISVDYLVRLEQSRETNPSPAVLAALARALRLDDQERMHLARIGSAAKRHPGLCAGPDVGEPDPSTLAVLDRLDTPAFILDLITDVIAWNDAYETLMTATGLFDLSPPNILRFTFLCGASRSVYADWEAIAREQVGNLRAAVTTCANDPRMNELVGELSVRSDDFARLWSVHDVSEKTRGVKSLVHPTVGLLNLRFEVLLIPSALNRRMVVYVPDDPATVQALDRLGEGERAPLRLVGGTASGSGQSSA